MEGRNGMENHWTTKDVSNHYGVSLSKSISNLWSKLRDKSRLEVGNGLKTSFWEDNVMEQGPLKQLFP